MSTLLLSLLLAAAPGSGYAIAHPLPKATVACAGDSIFAGACGQSVCSKLGTILNPGYVEVSTAVSGETADQIAHRIMAEASTACLGRPCGTYALNGGVNSLKILDLAETDDAAVAALALYGDGEEVLGMIDAVDWLHATYPYATIILTGVLPYAGCNIATCPSLVRPGNRAAKFNEALGAACFARAPWLKCVFPYADFEDPDNPDHLKPSIACEDGIHLKTLGHASLAAAVKAVRTWP